MTRPAIIFLACLVAFTLLFVLVGDALSVPDSHRALVMEQIQLRERHEARQKKARKLRQRYREWRVWRRDDIRERVHAWALHGLGDGFAKYAPCGVPWCALYVKYYVSECEPRHPLPANPASTSSWRAAIRRGVRGLRRVVERRHICRGDLVCFPWGHMGIFHRATGSGFWSIEGNCTGRVRLRWHPWGAADCFGRVLVTFTPQRFRGIAR